MKRIIALLITVVLLLSLITINAFAASGSFSGTSNPRPGETVTATFKVSGGNFYGYSGALEYDSSILTLQSVSSNAGSSWSFSRNGNNLVAYDSTGNNNPISSVFTAKFTVNQGVSVGSSINVSFKGTFSGDGTESAASGTYSATVAAPLSSDATLSSLVVGNATLSPKFGPSITSYSCGTVGFEVSKLSVSARAAASGAKVSVSGATLSVGENKVNVTVTAPNGSKKTYTISVTREQDPNYVPSSNTSLSGITLSAGQLSPAFEAGLKEYVIYVPFETEIISITPAAADPLAKGVETITDKALEVGKNELSVKCTAENGTEAVYKFYVIRMSKFEGISSIVTPLSKAEVTTTLNSEAENEKTSGLDSVSPVLLIVMSVACLVLGIAISAVILRNKYSREMRKALISSEALNTDEDFDITLPDELDENDNDKYLE